MITVRSTINLAHQSVPNIIPVVQGDTGRAILFTLADFTIPTGATARYFVTKPSGLSVYNDATIDGNTVLVELTAQSIIETGDNYGQVRISVGDDIVTSFDFILHVEQFCGIDAVESSTETNIFDKAVEDARETIDTMIEDAEQAIEDAAEAAEEYIAQAIDPTLSLPDKAADAKATGDGINALKADLAYSVDHAVIKINKTVTWQNGYVSTAGLIKASTLSGYAIIPMTAGERVIVGTSNSSITIIGSTTAESLSVGDTITVIKTTTSSGNYEEYSYIAKDDINIVVCVRMSDYNLNFYKDADFLNNIYNTTYNRINLIGLDSSVYYPVIIPTGTKLTMSTADGSVLGQQGLNILFYDADKQDISNGGWNFNPTATERTITVGNGGQTAYFVKWNTDPVKEVQLELGTNKTKYTKYNIQIGNPDVIKKVYSDEIAAEDVFNGEPYIGSYDWETPVVAYGALFNGAENIESFAFFTDPHIMGFIGRNEENMSEYIKKLSKVFRSVPCRFFVCGGDWLNNQTVADEACYRLGYAKALANNMLCGCKMVIGNHDTNYQGKADSESETGTGRLDDETIAALMFNDTETRKAYYSFDGTRTKCYVLDTGIEHNTMLEYDWEQVAWLAEKLAEDDAEHSIIFLHIITNNGEVQTNTSNFATLVEAYNDNTTVELNGITYDFTSCTGKVELWVGGHTHNDSNGTLGGVPYIITGSLSYNSNIPLIDLALVDYDNRVLKTIRAGGTGSDRTISLSV